MKKKIIYILIPTLLVVALGVGVGVFVGTSNRTKKVDPVISSSPIEEKEPYVSDLIINTIEKDDAYLKFTIVISNLEKTIQDANFTINGIDKTNFDYKISTSYSNDTTYAEVSVDKLSVDPGAVEIAVTSVDYFENDGEKTTEKCDIKGNTTIKDYLKVAKCDFNENDKKNIDLHIQNDMMVEIKNINIVVERTDESGNVVSLNKSVQPEKTEYTYKLTLNLNELNKEFNSTEGDTTIKISEIEYYNKVTEANVLYKVNYEKKFSITDESIFIESYESNQQQCVKDYLGYLEGYFKIKVRKETDIKKIKIANPQNEKDDFIVPINRYLYNKETKEETVYFDLPESLKNENNINISCIEYIFNEVETTYNCSISINNIVEKDNFEIIGFESTKTDESKYTSFEIKVMNPNKFEIKKVTINNFIYENLIVEETKENMFTIKISGSTETENKIVFDLNSIVYSEFDLRNNTSYDLIRESSLKSDIHLALPNKIEVTNEFLIDYYYQEKELEVSFDKEVNIKNIKYIMVDNIEYTDLVQINNTTVKIKGLTLNFDTKTSYTINEVMMEYTDFKYKIDSIGFETNPIKKFDYNSFYMKEGSGEVFILDYKLNLLRNEKIEIVRVDYHIGGKLKDKEEQFTGNSVNCQVINNKEFSVVYFPYSYEDYEKIEITIERIYFYENGTYKAITINDTKVY